MLDVSGKVALVTGASRGLGRSFALGLARHGCKLVLAARDQDKLDAVRREVEAQGGTAASVACDVRDPAAVDAAVEASEAALGPLSVLINNAGVAVAKPLLEQSKADWDQVLDTNLTGAFLMGQATARRMIANGIEGTIVNVASVHGFGVMPHLAPYCAAKAGLIHLTKAMALELARHRIRVNAIAPGYVETDMTGDFFHSEPGLKMIRGIPQRRPCTADDLLGPLLLLVSDESRYMTGSVVTVDGGFLLA